MQGETEQSGSVSGRTVTVISEVEGLLLPAELLATKVACKVPLLPPVIQTVGFFTEEEVISMVISPPATEKLHDQEVGKFCDWSVKSMQPLRQTVLVEWLKPATGITGGWHCPGVAVENPAF